MRVGALSIFVFAASVLLCQSSAAQPETLARAVELSSAGDDIVVGSEGGTLFYTRALPGAKAMLWSARWTGGNWADIGGTGLAPSSLAAWSGIDGVRHVDIDTALGLAVIGACNGAGRCRIFMSERETGRNWSAPVPVPGAAALGGQQRMPQLTPAPNAGDIVYACDALDGPEAQGGFDLYRISRRSAYQDVKPLIALNSSADEVGWCRGLGGVTWFSSSRQGGQSSSAGLDIWSHRSTAAGDEGWAGYRFRLLCGGLPASGWMVSTAPGVWAATDATGAVPLDGLHKDRAHRMEFRAGPEASPAECEEAPVVEVVAPDGGTVRVLRPRFEYGVWTLVLLPLIEVGAFEVGPATDRSTLNGRSADLSLEAWMRRDRAALLLYGRGASEISGRGMEQLEAVAAVMKRKPWRVLLISHTSSVGNAEANEGLAQRRAALAANTLIGMGVDPERIDIEGRGERELRNHCQDGTPCLPSEHAWNRRTVVQWLRPEGRID
jgi:outer membrane protein OmpA-like peptidoglycan-associated protein